MLLLLDIGYLLQSQSTHPLGESPKVAQASRLQVGSILKDAENTAYVRDNSWEKCHGHKQSIANAGETPALP